MREVFPRLGHVREFVNDDPITKFSQDYTQAISENRSTYTVPSHATPPRPHRPRSTLECAVGTVYETAHGPCTHNIAGFCEAHSLRAPWAGFKSAGCVVAPRACGRIFYAFWAEKQAEKRQHLVAFWGLMAKLGPGGKVRKRLVIECHRPSVAIPALCGLPEFCPARVFCVRSLCGLPKQGLALSSQLELGKRVCYSDSCEVS